MAIEQCRLALQYSPADKIAVYHLIVTLRHTRTGGQRDEIEALVQASLRIAAGLAAAGPGPEVV